MGRFLSAQRLLTESCGMRAIKGYTRVQPIGEAAPNFFANFPSFPANFSKFSRLFAKFFQGFLWRFWGISMTYATKKAF
jgi:hypothetical protein